MIDPEAILTHFYPEDTPLRRLLWKHSFDVWHKAEEIMQNPECAALALDRELVRSGALLHDVGIRFCHAPGILCFGVEPYIKHGILGGRVLRIYGAEHHLDLEAFARICERHTGSGMTCEEVKAEHLPIPARDYLPETPEEKLITLADKFFSKSGDMLEKPFARARQSLARFGEAPLARFDELCSLFGVRKSR